MSAPSHADVLVIGAGMAGLYAALLLQEQGVDVQVIEASAIPGGRIRTVMLGDKPIDVGGTGLGPSHHRAKALVERFALPTRPLTRRGRLAYSINGVLMDQDAWEHSPANLTVGEEREILPARLDSYYMQTLLPFFALEDWIDPAHAAYDIPFAEHLSRHGVSAEAQRLINMCINTNDIATVSALSIFRDAIKWRSVGYDDPKNFDQYGDALYKPVRIAGGMARLPHAMADALHRPLLTDTRAVAVEHDEAGVTVRTAAGGTFTARRLIVAVPMVTLRAIAFSPALPAPLSEAVAVAGSSGNTQFVLTTDAPFWETDGFAPSLWSDTMFERMFTEFDDDGTVEHLRIWINGDNAVRVDALGVEGAKRALLDTLARIRPSTAGHLTVHHMVSWGDEPLIGGEKYVLAPGEVTRFARTLAVPVGPIHWAGEHHKSLDVGIEAALQSGERAAREIVAAL